jgi:hypothetical protein
VIRPWQAPVALAFLLLALCPPVVGAAPAPREFFGVVPQGPLGPSDFDHMRGVVHTVRIPVYWFQVEPRQGEYDFTALDGTVAAAAAAGVRVLPFVYGTPAWLSSSPARPPLTPVARRHWVAFLQRLVQRYGVDGEFWRDRDKYMPIRRWQVWNEPNFVLFWRPSPAPRAYARLLEASARAIRGVDPRAGIVTAGVAPVEAGMRPWSFLREMYMVHEVRRAFDYVGLHPYAPYVTWVADQIRFVRQVMEEAGDAHKPLLLTEIGVASNGEYPNAFDRGRVGQATYLRRAFRLLLAKRRAWHIAGVDWFTWQDAIAADPHCVFCEYGGLFDRYGQPKPAWSMFRRVVASTSAHRLVR